MAPSRRPSCTRGAAPASRSASTTVAGATAPASDPLSAACRPLQLNREVIMDKIKPLYTATATAVGGRNGRTQTSDGVVKADLSLPKELGGPGRPGTATPEHLFAAGYAACFGGALDFVAKQKKRDASKARITCAVSIGPRDGGGFGLAVKLRVEDESIAH